MIILGEIVETIKNCPHGCFNEHFTDTPASGSPLTGTPSAVTKAIAWPWSWHSLTRKVKLSLCLIRAWPWHYMGGQCSAFCSGHLCLGKEAWWSYKSVHTLWSREKPHAFARNWTLAIQPAACCYTEPSWLPVSTRRNYVRDFTEWCNDCAGFFADGGIKILLCSVKLEC